MFLLLFNTFFYSEWMKSSSTWLQKNGNCLRCSISSQLKQLIWPKNSFLIPIWLESSAIISTSSFLYNIEIQTYILILHIIAFLPFTLSPMNKQFGSRNSLYFFDIHSILCSSSISILFHHQLLQAFSLCIQISLNKRITCVTVIEYPIVNTIVVFRNSLLWINE